MDFFALDFSGLSRVKEVRALDLFAVVEPGASLADLGAALEPSCFFFPPEPQEGQSVSVGRMFLTNPAYPGADKYGPFRNYVLGTDAVTPSGDTVKLGAGTLKNSSGMQIERFLSGSGGFAGIPTAMTLVVKPKYKSLLLVAAGFSSVLDGLSALSDIRRSTVVPCSLELADRGWIASRFDFPEDALLMLYAELAGHTRAVEEEASAIQGMCKANRAVFFNRGGDARGVLKMRRERRSQPPAMDAELTVHSFRHPASSSPRALYDLADWFGSLSGAIGIYAYCASGLLFLSLCSKVLNRGRARAEAIPSLRGLPPSAEALDSRERAEGPGWDCFCDIAVTGDRVSAALKRALDPVSVMNTGGASMG
jgi:FAD/FMN-containing dehydrogenase